MKDFFKEYKFYVIPAVYLMVAFLFLKFLIFPFIGKLSLKAEEINKKRMDNQIMEKRIEKIPEMKSDWEFLQGKKESLGVILNKEEQVDFIRSVEAVAETTGNEISLKISDQPVTGETQRRQRNPEEKKEGEKNIEDSLEYKNFIPLKIILKGNYSGLVGFMKKMENFKYYVNVLAINCEKDDLEKISTSSSSFDNLDF
jgi:hypothetical protein